MSEICDRCGVRDCVRCGISSEHQAQQRPLTVVAYVFEHGAPRCELNLIGTAETIQEEGR